MAESDLTNFGEAVFSIKFHVLPQFATRYEAPRLFPWISGFELFDFTISSPTTPSNCENLMANVQRISESWFWGTVKFSGVTTLNNFGSCSSQASNMLFVLLGSIVILVENPKPSRLALWLIWQTGPCHDGGARGESKKIHWDSNRSTAVTRHAAWHMCTNASLYARTCKNQPN